MSTIIEQAADAAAAVALVQVTNELREARRELAEAQAEVARLCEYSQKQEIEIDNLLTVIEQLKSGDWIPVEQLPPMTRHGIKASDLFLVQAKGYGRIVACYDFDSRFWRSWPNSGGLAEVYAYMPLPPEYEPPAPTTASVPEESESAAVPAAESEAL